MMVDDELNINKEMIPQTLQEDLQKKGDLPKVRPTQTHA
jgi:hypothetical protein